jgi:nucleoside-diphosphate-sugar epimerase
VIRSLLQGEAARCTHGNQIRDFLHVEDVASAFVALLQSDIQGTVNIGSGLPVSLKEVVEKIGKKIGRLDLIRLGDRVASPDDPIFLAADTQRLRKEANWASQYSLETGLDHTIQWWKDHETKHSSLPT